MFSVCSFSPLAAVGMVAKVSLKCQVSISGTKGQGDFSDSASSDLKESPDVVCRKTLTRTYLMSWMQLCKVLCNT